MNHGLKHRFTLRKKQRNLKGLAQTAQPVLSVLTTVILWVSKTGNCNVSKVKQQAKDTCQANWLAVYNSEMSCLICKMYSTAHFMLYAVIKVNLKLLGHSFSYSRGWMRMEHGDKRTAGAAKRKSKDQ